MTHKRHALFAVTLSLAALAGASGAQAEETTHAHPLCFGKFLPPGVQTPYAKNCTTINARFVNEAGAQNDDEINLDRINAKVKGACTIEMSTGQKITTDPNNVTLVDAESGQTAFTRKFLMPSGCAVEFHARREQIGPDEIRYFEVDPSDVTGDEISLKLNMHGATVTKSN